MTKQRWSHRSSFFPACLVATTILSLGCEVLGTGTSFALGWCSPTWLGRKRCKIPFCYCYDIAMLGLVRDGLPIGTGVCFQLKIRFGCRNSPKTRVKIPGLLSAPLPWQPRRISTRTCCALCYKARMHLFELEQIFGGVE